MLKSILIIAINHITHMKHLGKFSGANFGNNLHSGRLTFGRKNKSTEDSRSMKFTPNVHWDMIKITGEVNFIYFIIAI